MSIVVVPYTFLLYSHLEGARSDLRQLSLGTRVEALSLPDFQQGSELPQCLCDEEDLPSILFITVDVLHKLVSQLFGYLKKWTDGGRLKRVFLDEVYTIMSEQDFRPAYEALPKMAGLGMPICFMSGTLPAELVADLAKWLGVSKGGDDFVHLAGGDPVGDDFYLGVTCVQETNDIKKKLVSEVEGYRRQFIGKKVHVIASSSLA